MAGYNSSHAALLEILLKELSLDLSPPVGLGTSVLSTESLRPLRLWIAETRTATDSANDLSVEVLLTAFAARNGMDTDVPGWKVKAILWAVGQHPDFAFGKAKVRGRPKLHREVAGASVWEWWICVCQLRALLEVNRNRVVDDKEVASEMAVRKHKLVDDEDAHDKIEESTSYFYRELTYDKLRKLKNALDSFDKTFPSRMRKKSPFFTQRLQGKAVFQWEPSEIELSENQEWKIRMPRIRAELIERAKKLR